MLYLACLDVHYLPCISFPLPVIRAAVPQCLDIFLLHDGVYQNSAQQKAIVGGHSRSKPVCIRRQSTGAGRLHDFGCLVKTNALCLLQLHSYFAYPQR